MTAGPGYDLYADIPELSSLNGWEDVALTENGDPLVPVGPFTDFPDLFTNSVYYGERADSPYQLGTGNRLGGALITPFVRLSVAEKLRAAQRLLPTGHQLVVFDAYRPLEVQRGLYDYYLDSLRCARPELSETELSILTQNYVRLPSDDPTKPSPHNTGGSVDLAITRFTPADDGRISDIDSQLTQLNYETDWSLFSRGAENPYAEPDGDSKRTYLLEMERMLILRMRGEMLDFGTPFDHGGPEAALRYYEAGATSRLMPQLPGWRRRNEERRNNRRELCNAMTAGMVPYEHEWWHYNAPETQMGAKVLGLSTAHFGAQQLGPAHLAFEDMRRAHHAGLIKQFERLLAGHNYVPDGYRPDLNWAHELNSLALERMMANQAHPTATRLPKAAVIAPPYRGI